MPDVSQQVADEEFKKLSKKIEATYKQAYDEIGKTINEYFAKFKVRDEAMKARLEAGEITADYYKQWRLNQMGRGERYKVMQKNIADRMYSANETARHYINDSMAHIYTESRNFAAYTIEKAGASIDFTLMQESAVRAALEDGARTMPEYNETFPMARVNLLKNKDIAWGQKQITASVTSGIIQGKSIAQIADDLQQRIPEMNRVSALRAARTACGSAQNAGHQAVYSAAKKKGISGTKQWNSILDSRTRDSHIHLDGVKVDVDEEFPNGLMFPKDPDGEPAEVYNCRCRITYIIDEIADDFKSENSVGTYNQWKAEQSRR